MTNNLAYALAVEKLLGLEIPERSQYLRVLLNELTRIQSHLVWLGTHAMDIGALTVFLYCFREREELLRIFEAISGQRMMTSYIRIGGVALEPPAGHLRPHPQVPQRLPQQHRRVRRPAQRQPHLDRPPQGRRRSLAAKTPSPSASPAHPCAPPASTGTSAATCPTPATRSSSSTFPSRRTATSGPATSSACRRCASPSASATRRSTCSPASDDTRLIADAPKIVLPDREQMKTQMESLIHHFKIVTEGFQVPAGEATSSVEARTA